MNAPAHELLRQPPHSLEAERHVLGGILLANDAFDAVADVLVADDFFSHVHRLIWAELATLVGAGKFVDAVTLNARLDAEKVEPGYVSMLPIEIGTARNIRRYAEIVRERGVLRRIAAASMQLGDMAYEPLGRPSSELLDQAEKLLAGIADGGVKADAEPIGAYLRETVDELERRLERGGEILGLSTGLTDLDAKLNGLQNGDLVLIAARPSIGKTSLGLQVAQHVALAGKTALVFSLEMSRQQLTERMLSNLGRVNSHAMRSGRLSSDDWTGVSAAMSRLLDARLIVDDTTPLNVTQMRAKTRRAKRKHGLDLVVIDYIGLMDGEGEKRHEQVSDISRRLKALAREMEVPVVALAQLNRKSEDRTSNRPKLSDLRDSGSLEQDADVVMLLYRDDCYNEDSEWKGIAEIIVAKHRMGETGTVRTTFHGEHSRFADLSHDFQAPLPSMGARSRKRKGLQE